LQIFILPLKSILNQSAKVNLVYLIYGIKGMLKDLNYAGGIYICVLYFLEKDTATATNEENRKAG
jgi:hypothetical protein